MRTLLSMVAVALFCAPLYAQKVKGAPDVTDFPFWEAKKQPHAKPFVPGLNAVLELTAEQTMAIGKIKDETMGSDAVKAAMKAGKTDAEARKVIEDAQNKMFAQVKDVLKPAQKDLITKINAAYIEVATKAAEDRQADIASNKGNKEEQEKIRVAVAEQVQKDFSAKLTGLLSKEQKAAFEKAQEEAKKRAADAPKKVKPAK